MHRRSFLTAVGTGAMLSLAGCASVFEASLPDELDGVEPDPDQLPPPSIAIGPVTIAVYEDFGCPHCHEFQADVFPVLENQVLDSDEATYHHRDFPLPADDRSIPMANAARAVQAETNTSDDPTGGFFTYKTAVIEADDWSDDGLAEIAATKADVDGDVVREALEDETYYPTIAADWTRGDENGVDSTPTVLVDGEKVDDPFDADAIVAAVEDAS